MSLAENQVDASEAKKLLPISSPPSPALLFTLTEGERDRELTLSLKKPLMPVNLARVK